MSGGGWAARPSVTGEQGGHLFLIGIRGYGLVTEVLTWVFPLWLGVTEPNKDP